MLTRAGRRRVHWLGGLGGRAGCGRCGLGGCRFLPRSCVRPVALPGNDFDQAELLQFGQGGTRAELLAQLARDLLPSMLAVH
jgi:hypothetical protein